MKIISREQILFLHKKIIESSGGTEGIRDENLLDSAIKSPFQTFGGVDLYPTIMEKAARLGFNLISNHSFIDGNKRIGTHVMLVFLDINGILLDYKDEDLISLVLAIASGAKDYDELLEWLKEHEFLPEK